MKASLTSFTTLLILLFYCARAAAQPSNDFYANRTILTGTATTVFGDNTGATTEPGESTQGGLDADTVWYSWTAPAAGELYWAGYTLSNNYNLDVSFFVDTDGVISDLTAAPSAPDGGYMVTAGETLAIQVGTTVFFGNGGQTGPFSLGLSENVMPTTSTNDNFINSALMAPFGYQFSGFINGATVETNEPLPDPSVTQTLWWTFQPASDGILSIGVNASGFSPWLTVYQGTNLASLITVAEPAGGIYRLQAGQSYAIQVATPALPLLTGSFTLGASFTPQEPMSNDLFTNAEPLTGVNVTYLGDFSAATSEPGEPINGATNTIWVSWVAPYSGRAQFHIATAPQFQYCSVYTGTVVTNLQPVTLVGYANGLLDFLAMAGTTYYFQLSGGANTVLFNLTEEPMPVAPYDNFAQAQVLNGGLFYNENSVIGATMEPGEPQHMGPVPQKSVWWQWQAPTYGSVTLYAAESLVTNPVIAVYTGTNVADLTLVSKGTNTVQFNIVGGVTYHIAGAVPTNTIGEIMLEMYIQPDNSVHPVPGNLLQEPSWEGTALTDTTYWHWTGLLGGYVDEPNGVDGSTWPDVAPGQRVWQSFATIPGHVYEIRFACRPDGAGGNVQVSWDTNILGVFNVPAADSGNWNWGDYTTTAANTNATLYFYNLSGGMQMDAFSVVDTTAAPEITNEPGPISTIVGGTAVFTVAVYGSAPLSYQWYFNDTMLTNQNNQYLLLTSATTNDIGNYFVIVTNGFGSVTSTVAPLQVSTSPYPNIVWQPYGGTLPLNSYFAFDVAAVGPPPLSYQWYFNGNPITNATNQSLVFGALQLTNAGTYTVSVQNPAATVFSLPANLVVSTSASGGGAVFLINFLRPNAPSGNSPIYDVDGVTRLSGSNYLAQLYAGPSVAAIHPASAPEVFFPSALAGYFQTQQAILPDVPAGANAVVQIRVWEAAKGDSYEQARALGGKFGESSMLTVQAVPIQYIPVPIPGLQSFSLRAGLPYFEQAVIQFVQQLPDGSMVWSLTGAPGYVYLIEENSGNNVWQPYTTVTNVTGTVNFTNMPSGGMTLLRSRILD